MDRSFAYLRRGLFGVAFEGATGFGAAQAFTPSPWAPFPAPCSREDPFPFGSCSDRHGEAGGPGDGGRCQCWLSPTE
jgi:hypothetical protein